MKYPIGRLMASSTAIAALLVRGIVPAQANSLQNNDPLLRIAPEVLINSVSAGDLQKMPSGDLVVATANATVTIPSDSSKPVILASGAKTLQVTLPTSEKQANAVTDANGRVGFDNEDESTTSLIPKKDGSLQIATTIESASAPSSYRYELDVPPGSTLSPTGDGSVQIIASDGKFIAGVAAPWAKDATGKSIPTSYEIDGMSLIQIVEHKSAANVTYPVVADPWLGQDLYNQPYVSFAPQGYKINVTPTGWGVTILAPQTWWAHRDEVKTKLGGNAWRWTNSIQEQFYCHIAGVPASLPEYNLESWRPTINWAESLARYRCNPYDGGWSG